MSGRQPRTDAAKYVPPPRSGWQSPEFAAQQHSVFAEASGGSRTSWASRNKIERRHKVQDEEAQSNVGRSSCSEPKNFGEAAGSGAAEKASLEQETQNHSRDGSRMQGSSTVSAAASVVDKPMEPESGYGAASLQKCAASTCNYAVTWHKSHCCHLCMRWDGRKHGPKCEKRALGDSPGEAQEAHNDHTSSAAAAEISYRDASVRLSASAVAGGRVFDVQEWQEITALPTPRHSLAAVVADGTVYCIGGAGDAEASSAVERYWGKHGWDSACALPSPRQGIAATVIAGRIYVAGGCDANGFATNTAWCMNLRQGAKTWTDLPSMQLPRVDLALVGHEKRVYAIGGSDVPLVEYYDVGDPSAPWGVIMPGLQAPRTKLAAVSLGGMFYALGGMVHGKAVSTVETFDTRANDKWMVARSLLSPRHSFGATVLGECHICIVGGFGFNSLAAVHCFNTLTQTWSREISLPSPRSHLAVARQLNGSVMVFGGLRQDFTMAAVLRLSVPCERLDRANTEKSMLMNPTVPAKPWQLEALSQYNDKALLARLTPPLQVPRFHPQANGSPKDWNYGLPPLYWGKFARQIFCSSAGCEAHVQEPDVGIVMRFFNLRTGPDGRPIRELIGQPEPREGNWWRCAWKAFPGIHNLETKSSGQYAWRGQSDWQRVWHTCKFEALYSIMYHGGLFASKSEELGHRLHAGKAGVYVHTDAIGQKVGRYPRFVPLCRDGVFWAAKWELYVDRADRSTNKSADQWMQDPRSVQLSALWLCGRTAAQMEHNTEIARWWDPLTEANPLSQIWEAQPIIEQSQRDVPTNADESASQVSPASGIGGTQDATGGSFDNASVGNAVPTALDNVVLQDQGAINANVGSCLPAASENEVGEDQDAIAASYGKAVPAAADNEVGEDQDPREANVLEERTRAEESGDGRLGGWEGLLANRWVGGFLGAWVGLGPRRSR